MRALILAAGKGERLGKLSQSLPKPMIRIDGKPILQHNIELCRKFGITEIFINVHHFRHLIMDYFGDGSSFNVKITYSIEEELLGTSGAVRNTAEKFWKTKITGKYQRSTNNKHAFDKKHGGDDNFQLTESFYILYGDNLSNYNLQLLKIKAEKTDSILIIAFHYREDISSSGVAEFNPSGKILSFIEKPKPSETTSHWVNAGIYFVKPEILNYIPPGFSDFARDIFPKLIKENIPIYGVCENTEVKAFDTVEMYRKNFS
ncbi:MAG: nucleotidyltransferase family protein [Ignavibacteriales bacterium]|nr:MAG: nucleotidyltransferase family protein [Ignavibacteriales bacterium]